MLKLILIFIGSYLIYEGVIGYFAGEIDALGSTVAASGYMVRQDERPIEFMVTIIIHFAIGLWLIIGSFYMKK
ncbi:hypothetical protein [Thalassotalea agariperforans]